MSDCEPDWNPRAIDVGQMQAIALHTAYDISAAVDRPLDAMWIDKSMLGEAIRVLSDAHDRLGRRWAA